MAAPVTRLISDLPTEQTYVARDGVKLGYRAYEGGAAQVVVLIHGSSDNGAGMHPLAKARANLNQNNWDYIVGGTETETTVLRNRLALFDCAASTRAARRGQDRCLGRISRPQVAAAGRALSGRHPGDV